MQTLPANTAWRHGARVMMIGQISISFVHFQDCPLAKVSSWKRSNIAYISNIYPTDQVLCWKVKNRCYRMLNKTLKAQQGHWVMRWSFGHPLELPFAWITYYTVCVIHFRGTLSCCHCAVFYLDVLFYYGQLFHMKMMSLKAMRSNGI